MKLKSLLFLLLAVTTATVSWAQDGGVRGKVVSRLGREALSNVKVTLESTGLTVTTDENGNFEIENLPAGNHRITFTTPDFEELDPHMPGERIMMVEMVTDFFVRRHPALLMRVRRPSRDAGKRCL